MKKVIERSRELIRSEELKSRHRVREEDFSRVRCLTFPLLLTVILRKSVKSLQLVLNELTQELGRSPVSHSALSKARSRLKHTVFIELNQKAIVEVFYEEDSYKKYKGFRLLGIDGSKIRLPDTKEMVAEFGSISFNAGQGTPEVSHAYGFASVLYDVLNGVAVDSVLGHGRSYEVDLALKHLTHTQTNDLLLCDRGYPSYRFLATLCQMQRQFVIRCSAASFAPARAMLKGQGKDSQVVELKVHSSQQAPMKRLGLPTSIWVRFVRVTLKTGENEVLVTTLLDEQSYPTADFREIYHLRWGVEGFYSILKTRLELENFSGRSPESVYQDFYATVYLTGLESVLTAPAQTQLENKVVKNPQRVNTMVSFHAIKSRALALLFSESCDIDVLLQQLQELFLMNPTCRRETRLTPRVKSSERQRLSFWQRQRKHCF